MAETSCRYCRAVMPDTARVCPACGRSSAPPLPETRVASPPSAGRWATAPADTDAGPWSNDAEPGHEMNSTGSMSGGLAAPESEESIEIIEVRTRQRRLLWGLVAVVIFLIVLIGAVEMVRVIKARRGSGSAQLRAQLEANLSLLQQGVEAERRQAAQAIVDFGPTALVTALDRVTLEDTSTDKFALQPGAIRALASVGPSTVEGLMQALASPKANVRFGAASVLRELGAVGSEALESLVAATHDSNRWIRWQAIDDLGYLGLAGTKAVDTIVSFLHDKDAYTRRRAVEALGHLGPAAHGALSALNKTLADDSDRSVCKAADSAIMQIDIARRADKTTAGADREVRQLIEVFRGNDEKAAAAAAKELSTMGLKARDAVPALACALRHKDTWRREAAARALIKLVMIGDYLPTLQAAAKDADPAVRAAAEVALLQVEGSESH